MLSHPSSKNMLPRPSSPEFPGALKARRELRRMSRAALARAANIREVMPRRYEEPDCGEFARPRPETTWLALNRSLGFEIPADLVEDFSRVFSVEKNGLLGSGPLSDPGEAQWTPNFVPASTAEIPAVPGTASDLLLKNASLEDIIQFSPSKNIEPTFRPILIK